MNSVDIRALVADCQSHTHIQDWHARHLIAAIESLLAERDRLAVENAELRKKDGSGLIAEAEKLMKELTAANATLEALREALNGCVEPKCSSQEDYADLIKRFDAILYPKETENG